MSEEIKILAPELGQVWMDCAMMGFSDGKIGGNWTKVHAALLAAAPRLDPYDEKLLPRDDGITDLGL